MGTFALGTVSVWSHPVLRRDLVVCVLLAVLSRPRLTSPLACVGPGPRSVHGSRIRPGDEGTGRQALDRHRPGKRPVAHELGPQPRVLLSRSLVATHLWRRLGCMFDSEIRIWPTDSLRSHSWTECNATDSRGGFGFLRECSDQLHKSPPKNLTQEQCP